jgi:tRNA threonylcarbamoyl adenosine modification protein YeaZ
MGLFLALETATDTPSLALGSPDDPGPDLRLADRHQLSREIEAAATSLLAGRALRPGDLAGVIVADGPGSFTGLRIGVAFAKGLCRAAGLPLASAPSLLGAALAASGGRGSVLVEYDALRGDVYRALYRFGPGAVEVVVPPERVPALTPLPGPPSVTRAAAQHASAAALIRLRGLEGAVVTVAAPDAWEPVYGRLAEAEARHRARG